MKQTTLTLALTLALTTGPGFRAAAGELDKKIVTTPTTLDDSWRFSLALPAWATWLQGDTGLNGKTTHVDLGPGDIIPKIDMAADIRAEAHKGRFSVMGELLYLSLSDGIGTNTVVKKLDVRVDQTMADLGVGWRLIESPRGYLDVTAGVRYTNVYQRLTLQPNDEVIGRTSERLVDTVGERIRERVEDKLSEKDFRGKIRTAVTNEITDRLDVLKGKKPAAPTIPIPPLGGRLPGPIGDFIRDLIQSKTDEIKNAVRAEAEAAAATARAAIADKTAAARARAQAAAEKLRAAVDRRVTAAKKELSTKIADTLHDGLDRKVSRRDDWWDPYVGLRGRYNLNDKFYLVAKGDIGGFSVGADLSWQVEAAIGMMVTKNIFSEIGYRALGVDYEKDGLLMDTVTHGPQVTLGITF
jgi:hypothetical protein